MTFNCVAHKLALKAVPKQHFKNILGNSIIIKISKNSPKGTTLKSTACVFMYKFWYVFKINIKLAVNLF